MTEPLTRVAIRFVPKRINYWLRFGDPVRHRYIDRQRAIAWFNPDQIFGYLRWEANDYGTVLWRFQVLRAGRPDDVMGRVPGVLPGAEVLLRLDGKAKVKRGLAHVETLEKAGFDPAHIAPDHWRYLHNRLSFGETPRLYTTDQHHAWLARRTVQP
ncbi:MAG: DUF2840 domain-containing protein [Roseitalea porphyridii]|jgi:hypothetical protein|uniref:DUF2840 domain-containing protein n=1 Tax=Roseitalea porphyridii TaxID=1852022 RepID=UPI0032EBAC68